MKKVGSVIFLGLIIFGTALPGFAENRSGALTLSPFVGGYTFDDKQELETSPVFGLRAGYNITEHWGAEALVSYVLTQSNATNLESDVYRYGIDLLYHFTPERQFVPFLAAGLGGITYKTPDSSFEDHSAGVLNFGPGFKYFVAAGVALRADIRDLYVPSASYHNIEYTVGLTFQFGGTKQAAEQVPVAQEPAPAPVVAESAPILIIVPVVVPKTQQYCSILDISFEIDRDTIERREKERLGVLATFMKKYPDTTAVIEGHTDNVGSDSDNLALSQRRAENVVNYLANNEGIARSRLSAVGYGESRPIADNRSEEGKRLNRRIDAVIACATDIEGLKTAPRRVTMALEMEFNTNRADVNSEYREDLRKVANFMKANPSITATVEGHASNQMGTAEQAMQLSSRRAQNVVDYMVKEFGVDRSRVFAQGFGDTRRFAYNTSVEGRKENRRINIIFNYPK